jgi:hypothetical protein
MLGNKNMVSNNKYNQPLILFGLLWACLITVLRALRWPNDWTEAHWLISYEFGFIKRALPGTLISPFVDFESAELVIKIVSAIFLVLFILLLVWICYRVFAKQFNSVLVALLFLTSPYIVMSGHLNGYYDNIVMIISILACQLVMREKIWSASILLAIGMFVHETILLVGLPSVVFIAFIKHVKNGKATSFRRLFEGFIFRYKMLLAIPLLVFICIIVYQLKFMDSGIIKDSITTHLSQFKFIEGDRNFHVPSEFTTSFIWYLKNQSPEFFNRIFEKTYLVQIGLPLSVLLVTCWHRLREITVNRTIFFSLVIIIALPLSLHLVAWDTSRIWTYPLVVSMLALWGLSEIFPQTYTQIKGYKYFSIIIIAIIVFQLFSLIELMGGAQERFTNGQRILLYTPSLLAFLTCYLLARKPT